jgi:hypothetical protein
MSQAVYFAARFVVERVQVTEWPSAARIRGFFALRVGKAFADGVVILPF